LKRADNLGTFLILKEFVIKMKDDPKEVSNNPSPESEVLFGVHQREKIIWFVWLVFNL